MKILLLGFETFDTLPFNPSERVVREIGRAAQPGGGTEITAEVLPTEYDRAGAIGARLIRQVRPDIVLGTGVAASRAAISLERVALNIDDAEIPDNAGILRSGSAIDPRGPLALEARCDLVRVQERLRREAIACAVSTHAGTYICNHLYYTALRTLGEIAPAARCLFVHFPMPGLDNGLSIATLVAATRIVLAALKDQATQPA